ncbi:MAG: sigma-70 family RNA polymerase sigma factor [Nannocystis sp.]|nr:sigma-70 family RNA polymerase sigma factor [Nannocystis sp.]MBA3548729.1 sigma-70 family RNA polymerase sigma factor [Nannocystis sp.]
MNKSTKDTRVAAAEPALAVAIDGQQQNGRMDLAGRPERLADASDAVESEATAPLALYFREIARAEIMSREQECTLAARIEERRRSLWRATFSYPPFVAGICELAREVLPAAACPGAALDAMSVAARKLRDRDLVTHRQQYEHARRTVTDAFAGADVDNLVADRVLADLVSIEGGQQGGLSLKVKLPPRGSLPFLRYVHGVRREYHAFWAARAEFVQANLRLVVTIARRYSRGRMALPDLIQEGNLGLMKAVNRFDPRKGCRFSTYGSWWIRHAVTRAIADKGRTVRLPVHMIDAHGKVLRARRQFEARHGRPASEAEVAESCGVSPERLARMRVSLLEAPASFDQRLSGDTDLTLLDVMEDTTTTPAPEAMDHELQMEHLDELFATLPPFEAEILRKRMGMNDGAEMTLKEIGHHYGLSRERIRQLQEQALARLRAEFDRRGLL